jgi:hypothetical protein
VVEGARLESVYMGNRIMGSNPILSAIKKALNFSADLDFIFPFYKYKSAIFLNNDIIFFFQILKK